jgi:hypothetical protein
VLEAGIGEVTLAFMLMVWGRRQAQLEPQSDAMRSFVVGNLVGPSQVEPGDRASSRRARPRWLMGCRFPRIVHERLVLRWTTRSHRCGGSVTSASVMLRTSQIEREMEDGVGVSSMEPGDMASRADGTSGTGKTEQGRVKQEVEQRTDRQKVALLESRMTKKSA